MSHGDSPHVDLFDSTYRNFDVDVLARVRQQTFGEDFGQNSWTTIDEYERWVARLGIDATTHVLEVACGSGGPAALLAERWRCRVTGIDVNAHGVSTARTLAQSRGLVDRLRFSQADANAPLPFADATFDTVLCIDSANHFADRLAVLKEWHRVLRPRGRVLFTDPVVITGLVTNEELALRSSIGRFVFAPPGVNEQLITGAGFDVPECEDVTANAALVSGRWRDARREARTALVALEGEDRYEGLQRFFDAVHRLTHERRLSRLAYLLRKRFD